MQPASRIHVLPQASTMVEGHRDLTCENQRCTCFPLPALQCIEAFLLRATFSRSRHAGCFDGTARFLTLTLHLVLVSFFYPSMFTITKELAQQHHCHFRLSKLASLSSRLPRRGLLRSTFSTIHRLYQNIPRCICPSRLLSPLSSAVRPLLSLSS